jgi:toxin ParE1/3/4
MIVRWTHEASEELDDVLSYIASQNPAAAARVAERIERSVTSLAEFPCAGRRNPASGSVEWVVPGLPLLIIYTIPPPTWWRSSRSFTPRAIRAPSGGPEIGLARPYFLIEAGPSMSPGRGGRSSLGIG